MSEVDRCEPASIYLLSLILPITVLATTLAGGRLTIIGLILPLLVYPLLELLLGSRASPLAPRPASRNLELLLVLHILLQFAILASLLRLTLSAGPVWTTWVAAVACGFSAGIAGIVSAHEFGHYSRGPRRMLANVMMQAVAYPHFNHEHNRNHHRYVAMERDGASAPRGRGFWKHVVMTVPLQWLSAYREMADGRPAFHNPVLQRTLLTVLLASALLYYDVTAGLVWLLYSAAAIYVLEYTNYIRHYGLHRADGEAIAAHHSWDSEARWSRWTLLELTRHSAHHLKASEPFWRLQPTEGAARLPGYYACFWPCMLPPLWRRMLHPRLDLLEAELRGKAV